MSNTNAVIVPTVVDEPMDFTVIATSPKDMEAGQRSLILWAARKIQSLKNESAEANEQLALHQQKKWDQKGWRNQLAKIGRRIDFYRKIKMALEHGYYIVPPFPIDIFAIRTKRTNPIPRDGKYKFDRRLQFAQILPAGHGRYVSDQPIQASYGDVTDDGKQVTRYYADNFRDVDFPFKLARAEIREATDKALELKLFDQLGVLPARRGADPIVCGQILSPDKRSDAPITFFIAWWIDTRTL